MDAKLKILVIGSGGREHAMCWMLAKTAKVFCTPGNAGIAQEAACLELKGFDDITRFCKEQEIDLVVIGPEQPLVDGLSDHLRTRGIAVFGPSKAAAQLEASKAFTKTLCVECGIPTAAYAEFTDAEPAKAYVRQQGAPIVVKADGLAAGKGVTVAQSVDEACIAIDECFAGRFGAAGNKVVVEEFLQGEEASFFALCDGTSAIEFASAQDHKAVGDGDTGPNTGGMGTYSPAPIVTDDVRQRVMDEIILPAVKGMKSRGTPYQGVLFAGLMIGEHGPKLIEFNCRFGDPETQVMLPRVQGDLGQLLLACAKGKLEEAEFGLSPKSALCVVMAAKGYPGDYQKGTVIRGLDAANQVSGVKVLHAGTALKDGYTTANGGRVLGITALADTLQEAQNKAYDAVKKVDWPEGFCRTDIGWRALKK